MFEIARLSWSRIKLETTEFLKLRDYTCLGQELNSGLPLFLAHLLIFSPPLLSSAPSAQNISSPYQLLNWGATAALWRPQVVPNMFSSAPSGPNHCSVAPQVAATMLSGAQVAKTLNSGTPSNQTLLSGAPSGLLLSGTSSGNLLSAL